MSRFAFFVALLACSLNTTGCGTASKIKKLSEIEYNQYIALRPFMSEDERTGWLKLKTDAEKDEWLKAKKCCIPEQSLWEKFYQYNGAVREQILAGKVVVGWTKDQVLMAWGAPYDKRKLTGRPAARSELLVYRFERHQDGSVLVFQDNSKTLYKAVSTFTRLAYVDDDRVTSITEKNGWVEE
ncbi:MAG: hypothetical protein EXR69_06780 [Myxococcales bacterium]|nr:hypothetical protein [Myxococcales bacterium]